MNANISIGTTPETGKTDVLISRPGKRYFAHAIGGFINPVRAHCNITNASFARLFVLISKRGKKTHKTETLEHYRIT